MIWTGDAMVSRVERTPFAAWWWTVDRLTLAAMLGLMLAGIVLSLAASPPVAARLEMTTPRCGTVAVSCVLLAYRELDRNRLSHV